MWPLGLHACNDVVLLADKAAGSDSQKSVKRFPQIPGLSILRACMLQHP